MKPNQVIETLTGSGIETVNVSSQYLNNEITITGLSVGVVTIKGVSLGNTTAEPFINGRVPLAYHKTLRVRNRQITAFEFTVTPESAYTVKIKQTNADTER